MNPNLGRARLTVGVFIKRFDPKNRPTRTTLGEMGLDYLGLVRIFGRTRIILYVSGSDGFETLHSVFPRIPEI